MGLLKEVPIIVEDERVGKDSRRMTDDLVVRLQGTEKGPDQGREDKQGDQEERQIGGNGLIGSSRPLLPKCATPSPSGDRKSYNRA